MATTPTMTPNTTPKTLPYVSLTSACSLGSNVPMKSRLSRTPRTIVAASAPAPRRASSRLCSSCWVMAARPDRPMMEPSERKR